MELPPYRTIRPASNFAFTSYLFAACPKLDQPVRLCGRQNMISEGGGDDGGSGDDDVNNNDGLGELGGYHILASAGADRLVKLWTCRK